MKVEWIAGKSSERLVLFFTGWGMDAEPFRAGEKAYDTLIVWDYTELSGLPELPADRPVDVIAWSMGVWAAEQVLAGRTVASATAVNGTPWPIDERRGIPPAVFDGTLAGFSEAGLLRFRRRMCGGGAGLQAFLAVEPKRPVADLGAELAALGAAIRDPARAVADHSFWTRAIACREDRIFPLAAQQTAFPQAEVVSGAHWDGALFARFLNGEAP